MDALIERIQSGDRRSLARAMSLVEGSGPDADGMRERLRAATGRVPWWGFTGPPGVGKSTLIDALLHQLRERGKRIGVVAVDPTSPKSHGALLGDRVRMMRHAEDESVFIRSLAARGREGGLSDAALHCARLLEAAGFDPVLIETVGVGQNEVDVASVADFCVVMLGPGYGDDIQLIKAGLLEIADVVVVNKCDLAEANRLLTDILAERAGSLPVFGVEAKSGLGLEPLLEQLLGLDEAARDPERQRGRAERRALGEVERAAMLAHERSLRRAMDTPEARELVCKLSAGELSLDSAVMKLTELARLVP